MYDVLISRCVYVAILSEEECHVWFIIVWVCSTHAHCGGTSCMLVSRLFSVISRVSLLILVNKGL